MRTWNALPDSLISSAEGAEDSVAKFTSLVSSLPGPVEWLSFWRVASHSSDTEPRILKFVSSQCARGESSIARKPEVHPNILSGKTIFKDVTFQMFDFIPVC